MIDHKFLGGPPGSGWTPKDSDVNYVADIWTVFIKVCRIILLTVTLRKKGKAPVAIMGAQHVDECFVGGVTRSPRGIHEERRHVTRGHPFPAFD